MASAEQIPPPMTPLRKWVFRIIAGIVLPVAIMVLLEITLRLGGYGYTTGFFKPMRIGNQDFLVENDCFGYRFFPPDIARTPETLRIPAKKAPDTYRIFILGESAALGDPEPAFGAGRYLEVLLRARFPKTKFEVVNVAMTAINSHVILPIARDCAGLEGDLWILYIGNNEMVGPFGAATVFGAKTPPLRLIRLSLAVQKLRVGQLLLNLSRKFKEGSRTESWSGMEMFLGNQVAPDAPARELVYQNFDRNLADIVRAGLDSGAKILLNTVAVNLKDCPPFASMHNSGISATELAGCDTNYQEGCQALQQTHFAEAVEIFAQAAKCDPRLAGVQYQWGEALMKLTNFPAAAGHFQQACDDDALPFRATSRINGVIREVGRRLADPNLDCFDAIVALQTNAPVEICGLETFYEHVHLNFDGNYRLARAWASKVEDLLPGSIRSNTRKEWASQELCEQRLGLTFWDRYNVNTDLTGRRQRPPLNSQVNNGPLLDALLEQGAQLKQSMASVTNRNHAREVYADALLWSPDDYSIRASFAEFLSDTGETSAAIAQWQKLRELFPQAYAPCYQLGRLAADQHEFDRAKQFLTQTLAMRPSFAPGWFDLGSVHASTSNYDLAISAFAQALRFDPMNSKYFFYDGLAKAMAGRKLEAITQYRQAVRFDPANWMAHYELGGLLGQEGNMIEAKNESEAAVRLNPAFPISHINLGLALTKLGDLDGAERQFEETLRLDPGNTRAEDYLAQVKALKNNKK